MDKNFATYYLTDTNSTKNDKKLTLSVERRYNKSRIKIRRKRDGRNIRNTKENRRKRTKR